MNGISEHSMTVQDSSVQYGKPIQAMCTQIYRTGIVSVAATQHSLCPMPNLYPLHPSYFMRQYNSPSKGLESELLIKRILQAVQAVFIFMKCWELNQEFALYWHHTSKVYFAI